MSPKNRVRLKPLSILSAFCASLFLISSYQFPQQASSEKTTSQTAGQRAMLRARHSQREMGRASFSKGRWMLQMANVPFNPDILMRPRWRERLKPIFDQMPQMRTVQRLDGPLAGVHIADTLSLPEEIQTNGDTLIMAREVVFDGCSPVFRGKGNLFLFFIEPPKSRVSIDQLTLGRIQKVSFGTSSVHRSVSHSALLWSRGLGTWVQQTCGTNVVRDGAPAQFDAFVDPSMHGGSPDKPAAREGQAQKGDDGTCGGSLNGQQGEEGDWGIDAADGAMGVAGSRGGDATGAIVCDIPDGATGSYTFSARGHRGGRGGDGGKGGEGGDAQQGGKGGRGANCCSSLGVIGNGGPGGPGGRGGSGGSGADGRNGGDGGNGKDITVTYPAQFNQNNITAHTNGGAPGGAGLARGLGQGGAGGAPGNPGDPAPSSFPSCGFSSAGGPGITGGQGPTGPRFGDAGQSNGNDGTQGNLNLTQRAGGTDNDQDGYTVEDGDCNDANENIYPGAALNCQTIGSETICGTDPPPDVNCNGNDDCFECLTPIILNFSGSLQLTSPERGVTFDLRADGNPVRISWTLPGADDAFLALDHNGNGRIDDGSELIGNRTPLGNGQFAFNGFEVLAWHDLPANGGNGNGTIDAGDRIYPRLKLWRDINHNGRSERAELTTLAAAGVRAIQIEYQYSDRQDRYGNLFHYRAEFFLTGENESNRRRYFAWDVIFALPM